MSHCQLPWNLSTTDIIYRETVSKVSVVINMNILLYQRQQHFATVIGEMREKEVVVVVIMTMRPVHGSFPSSVLDCRVLNFRVVRINTT